MFPSLVLVGDQAPRMKDDGIDFGCVLIHLNGVVAQIEIKGYCIRLVNSCNTMLVFGNW